MSFSIEQYNRFEIIDRTFPTRDDAFYALRRSQASDGYGISKQRSKPHKIWVVCHQSGTYKPYKANQGKYKTNTIKSDCPFKIIINKQSIGEFGFEQHEDHDHRPTDKLEVSSRLRHISQQEYGIDKVINMIEERSKDIKSTARSIADSIQRDYPAIMVNQQDVWKFQRELTAERYGSSTSTAAFVNIASITHITSDTVWLGGEEWIGSREVPYVEVNNNPINNVPQQVFWIHREHIEEWRRSPELLMIDCTYKTNRFNMPLLEIIGITALGTTFNVAFGLTATEDVQHYLWLLAHLRKVAEIEGIPLPKVVMTDFEKALKNALSITMPHTQQQLCVWHILKNVTLNIKRKWIGSLDGCEIMGKVREDDYSRQDAAVGALHRQGDPVDQDEDDPQCVAARCSDAAAETATNAAIERPLRVTTNTQRQFENTGDGIRDAWIAVTRAENEEEFEERWALIKREFLHQEEVIHYLNETYIPWREQFVRCWIKQFRNYGLIATSRGESAHRQLKDHLKNRFTDLPKLLQAIRSLQSLRRQTYDEKFYRDTQKRPTRLLEHPLFKQILTKISRFAVDQLERQVQLAIDELKGSSPSSACTGSFEAQWGLLCRHDLLIRLQEEPISPLRLDDIDAHWWLKGWTDDQHAHLAARHQPDPEIINRRINNSPHSITPLIVESNDRDTLRHSSGRIMSNWEAQEVAEGIRNRDGSSRSTSTSQSSRSSTPSGIQVRKRLSRQTTATKIIAIERSLQVLTDTVKQQALQAQAAQQASQQASQAAAAPTTYYQVGIRAVPSPPSHQPIFPGTPTGPLPSQPQQHPFPPTLHHHQQYLPLPLIPQHQQHHGIPIFAQQDHRRQSHRVEQYQDLGHLGVVHQEGNGLTLSHTNFTEGRYSTERPQFAPPPSAQGQFDPWQRPQQPQHPYR